MNLMLILKSMSTTNHGYSRSLLVVFVHYFTLLLFLETNTAVNTSMLLVKYKNRDPKAFIADAAKVSAAENSKMPKAGGSGFFVNSRDYKSIMYVVVQAFERALILGEVMTLCIRSIGMTHTCCHGCLGTSCKEFERFSVDVIGWITPFRLY
jgi:hypothetical protein